MWTDENRAKYNRDHLRYPSDLTDEEWALVEPFIPPARRGGGKRRTDLRAVMNGVMYILSTGCQWRYLPRLGLICSAIKKLELTCRQPPRPHHVASWHYLALSTG